MLQPFLFSEEHLSSEKSSCYENIFSSRFFLGMMAIAPFASLLKSNAIFAQKKGMFIHHVYFWLKNSGNKEDKAKLIEGLKKLSRASTIRNFYIGQPAVTRREVIDSSYDVSWLLFFD